MMRIERDGPVAILSMEAPRANALSRATITALSKALYDIEQGDAAALVLTGKGRVFCAGLDLIEASQFDRPALADYVDQFESLFLQLFSYRLPAIAALNGHALAGGAILALACDLRIAANTPLTFGLNEVELGLSFPSAALQVALFGVPPQHWAEAIELGRRYTREEAMAAGIVHFSSDDPVAAAVSRAKQIAELGARAVQFTKADLRHDALVRARARAIESRRRFVDAWMTDALPRIHAAVERLRSS